MSNHFVSLKILRLSSDDTLEYLSLCPVCYSAIQWQPHAGFNCTWQEALMLRQYWLQCVKVSSYCICRYTIRVGNTRWGCRRAKNFFLGIRMQVPHIIWDTARLSQNYSVNYVKFGSQCAISVSNILSLPYLDVVQDTLFRVFVLIEVIKRFVVERKYNFWLLGNSKEL